MRLFVAVLFLIISSVSSANVSCSGIIKNIYKWDYFDTLSIRLEMADGVITRYISLPLAPDGSPSRSDESLALMAYASKDHVNILWADPDITTCADGWAHNKKLKGYFSVGK